MKLKYITTIILGTILILSVVYIFTLRQENFIYKKTIELDSSITNIYYDISLKADEYYELASEDYIRRDYDSLINNCEKAREYFLDESQEYRKLQAEINDYNNEVLNLYDKLLDEKISMANNLYEACEYFESAARYYDIYYNSNVPYNDPSYDMGTSSINKMGDKIEDHDEAVERHNDLLAEIGMTMKWTQK